MGRGRYMHYFIEGRIGYLIWFEFRSSETIIKAMDNWSSMQHMNLFVINFGDISVKNVQVMHFLIY
jgi:hypothetical protein